MENPDNTKQKPNTNEKRTRLGLLRKLKDTKDDNNIIDDSPSPFKNSKVSYDKKAQLKQNENKSIMQKLLESKRKKEQLKSKYDVSASSKDNNAYSNNDNDNDNNIITTSNDDNDHANTKSTITTVSSSSSTTLTHANNITNKLKQLLQSKSEDVEHNKDNSGNRSESNDNGNNGNVNVCDNDNEVSCAKGGEIKQQAQVTKVKMALSNKKNNKQSDVNSGNSVSEVSQQTHKANEVKNILEMIKQKKNQKEQLQRSFEMEQQQQKATSSVSKEEDEQVQVLREDVVDGDKKCNNVIDNEDKVTQQEQQQQQEEENERKRIKEEEEKKQREETRKLLLEELRKEVTKEITESVKKEFEEKVKRKQEEIEQKEKALLEREREAKEKLQQTQTQTQTHINNNTNEDDLNKNTNYYKQPKGASHSAMNIPKYNNTQQQQQQAYSNEHLNETTTTTTSNTTNQVNAPTSTYYKKQNHVMIYNKKPNLRGRSADKTNNSNTPILNTNPNSLNNTHLYTNKQYLQQQHNYTNGMVNNNTYQQQYYTNKTSRYIPTNQTPINIDTANTNNTSYLYYNNNINNSSVSYNYTNPFQYNDYTQMAPPSVMYNNYQQQQQQLQQQPYSYYRPPQPESLSMNFEDLLLFEQKLMDIIRDFIEDKPMTNECFEWWNYYFNCSLYKQLEKTFKNETSRQIVQESINYQLLSIIICYDVSSKPYVYDQVKVMIKPILLYNHHNLIIIYENILSKVSTESINNIWVTKLRNLIYTVKSSSSSSSSSSLHNEMNPDNVFINSPTPYDALSVVDKIEYITLSIIGNIRILLKNYSNGETTSVLVNLFKTLKHKTYEEINDIFLSKILRVDNPNGSVLASVLIRENAYFSTVEAPYLKNPSIRPFTLVLDLDETIIHFKINEHNETEGVLQVRPGIQEFLTTIGQFYEIVIFTAATQDYADLLIEELEENTFYFDYKLYRQHTIIIGNNFVKDLTRLGRPLDKVIIVDNMPQNFRLQKENGIHIRPFWGDDAQDTALIELQPILVNIAKEGGDVRKGLRKYKDEIMNKVTMNQTYRC